MNKDFSYEALMKLITTRLPDYMEGVDTCEVLETLSNRGVSKYLKFGGPFVEQRKKELRIPPIIYCNSLYRIRTEELAAVSDEDFLKSLAKHYFELCEEIDAAEREHSILHFDNIKGAIRMLLVSKKANEEWLRTVPYRDFLDMAIVYAVDGDPRIGIIDNVYLLAWDGVTEETLYETAQNNLEIASYKVFDMVTLRAELVGTEHSFFQNVAFGAGALALPGLANICEKMLEHDVVGHDTVYLLPSSVHEVIAMCAGEGDGKEFLSMVKEVNWGERVISRRDVLTTSIYRYDRSSRSLVLDCTCE